MKYVKTLGMAFATLMVATSTASATYLTSPAGTTYTGTITAEGDVTALHPSNGTSFLTVSCKSSHFEATVTQHGASTTAAAKMDKLSFTECGNDTVTVLIPGQFQPSRGLEMHSNGITGYGTVTFNAIEIRYHTSEGPVCTVKTSGTDIGLMISSKVTEGNATIDIGESILPMSGFLCPSFGIWTGDYTITTPTTLEVH